MGEKIRKIPPVENVKICDSTGTQKQVYKVIVSDSDKNLHVLWTNLAQHTIKAYYVDKATGVTSPYKYLSGEDFVIIREEGDTLIDLFEGSNYSEITEEFSNQHKSYIDVLVNDTNYFLGDLKDCLVDKDLNVYINYHYNKYLITYMDFFGQVLTTQQVEYSDKGYPTSEDLTYPVHDNLYVADVYKEFLTWSLNNDNNIPGVITFYSDTTLYPVFNNITIRYLIAVFKYKPSQNNNISYSFIYASHGSYIYKDWVKNNTLPSSEESIEDNIPYLYEYIHEYTLENGTDINEENDIQITSKNRHTYFNIYLNDPSYFRINILTKYIKTPIIYSVLVRDQLSGKIFFVWETYKYDNLSSTNVFEDLLKSIYDSSYHSSSENSDNSYEYWLEDHNGNIITDTKGYQVLENTIIYIKCTEYCNIVLKYWYNKPDSSSKDYEEVIQTITYVKGNTIKVPSSIAMNDTYTYNYNGTFNTVRKDFNSYFISSTNSNRAISKSVGVIAEHNEVFYCVVNTITQYWDLIIDNNTDEEFYGIPEKSSITITGNITDSSDLRVNYLGPIGESSIEVQNDNDKLFYLRRCKLVKINITSVWGDTVTKIIDDFYTALGNYYIDQWNNDISLSDGSRVFGWGSQNIREFKITILSLTDYPKYVNIIYRDYKGLETVVSYQKGTIRNKITTHPADNCPNFKCWAEVQGESNYFNSNEMLKTDIYLWALSRIVLPKYDEESLPTLISSCVHIWNQTDNSWTSITDSKGNFITTDISVRIPEGTEYTSLVIKTTSSNLSLCPYGSVNSGDDLSGNTYYPSRCHKVITYSHPNVSFNTSNDNLYCKEIVCRVYPKHINGTKLTVGESTLSDNPQVILELSSKYDNNTYYTPIYSTENNTFSIYNPGGGKQITVMIYYIRNSTSGGSD